MKSTAQSDLDPQAPLPTGPHTRRVSLHSHGGAWRVDTDRPMGVGLRVAGVWNRPCGGELHRTPRERQDGNGMAGDWDHRHGNGFLSDGGHCGHQGARAGRARRGEPIQGRQKEQGESVSTPADGWCATRTSGGGG